MNNCPIPDDDFIEEYLREPLTPEKKTELQQMRDEWEQARQEELQRNDDP
jgi:DNA-binding IclR family transcriptional regulator